MRTRIAILAAVAAVFTSFAALAAIGGATADVTLKTSAGAEAGRITMKQMPGGVYIQGQLTGLTPGARGFHVHEKGLCEGPEFSSAGGHYNPGGHEHGQKSAGGPHRGDLPNIVAGAQGSATVQFFAPNLSLDELLARPEGAALIVHAAADDYTTQPSGNAGARELCGVISPAR